MLNADTTPIAPGLDLDAFGRPTITDAERQRIRDAFAGVNGRAALILLGDSRTKTMKGHVVGNLPSGWKVAAGGGFDVDDKEPFVDFAIVKVW